MSPGLVDKNRRITRGTLIKKWSSGVMQRGAEVPAGKAIASLQH